MIQKRMEMRGQGGFTLIELLVVVAILAILAGVAVFAVGNIRKNAAKNACLTEAGTFQTALDAWSVDKLDNPAQSMLKNTTGKYFTMGGTSAVPTIGTTAAWAEVSADCAAPTVP